MQTKLFKICNDKMCVTNLQSTKSDLPLEKKRRKHLKMPKPGVTKGDVFKLIVL